MPAPVAFYWVCKGLFLLGMVYVIHELVIVLAVILWILVGQWKDITEDIDY